MSEFPPNTDETVFYKADINTVSESLRRNASGITAKNIEYCKIENKDISIVIAWNESIKHKEELKRYNCMIYLVRGEYIKPSGGYTEPSVEILTSIGNHDMTLNELTTAVNNLKKYSQQLN